LSSVRTPDYAFILKYHRRATIRFLFANLPVLDAIPLITKGKGIDIYRQWIDPYRFTTSREEGF
jgi:hypothetical protein